VSVLGFVALSISTYAAHTERYLVPIFLMFIALFFRNSMLIRNNVNKIKIVALLLLLTQLPNIYLMTTNAFWVKNVDLSSPDLFQAGKDIISQLLTYYSPKELFGISSDINYQHSIPALSLFYPWMLIPYLIGIYELCQLRKTLAGKYLILLFLTAGIPGALSGRFISIQRVLPLIIPTILIITLGIEKIRKSIRPLFFVPAFIVLMLFSLILLWRSYFVFFPTERGVWWNYGYEELARIIEVNQNVNYTVDNSRAGASYILPLFFLKYSPDKFQKQFDSIFVRDYYSNPPYNANYRIGNVDVRPIKWEKDIFIDQVLVGDELMMSPEQATEHFLEKVIDIKDLSGKSVLLGYKTNPTKKIEDNERKMRLLEASR